MIVQWIKEGGSAEDEPHYSRSFNHYLDPISNSGYMGIFNSASQWAQSQGFGASALGGRYAWPDVRGYYYLGLTGATSGERDANLADTFRGLGQLTHLVSDMSVPAHTRNDGHILYNYEDWVKANPDAIFGKPDYYTGAMNGISSLFDTGQYNGTNPDVTTSTGVGLAEFTNANFFSEDTIYAGYQYPGAAGAVLWTDASNNRNYLMNAGPGLTVEHLAASSFLYFYRLRYFPNEKAYLPVGLDDKVYLDYASLLLPRAVGYSTNLLNYFFRGKIGMDKAKDSPGGYVIMNNSGEPLYGTFGLYYDDTDGNRHLVTEWPDVVIGAGAASDPLTFDAPTTPAPSEPDKYMLVFSGALGAESGAVAGALVNLKPNDRWEDWDDAAYTPTGDWVNDNGSQGAWRWGRYTITTQKRTWYGVSYYTYYDAPPEISVDNGLYSVNAISASSHGYIGYNTGYISSPHGNGGTIAWLDIPVSKCVFKMNVPQAEIIGVAPWNTRPYYRIVLYAYNPSASDYNVGILYEADGPMHISSGLEADLRSSVAVWNAGHHYGGDIAVGDITQWRVIGVVVGYAIYGNSSLNVALDYIDFVCGE
ncbi:MAG: hypothetical protein HY894_01205 [Deltaproteobacteria bacterium]|nr:hypothetical protein [Deltaproteobacteria bacterium]